MLARIDFRSDWQLWIGPIEDAYYALDGEDLNRRISDHIASHPEDYFLDD